MVQYDYNHIVSYLREHTFSILDNLIAAAIWLFISILPKYFKALLNVLRLIPIAVWHILVFLYNTFFPISQLVFVVPAFYFMYKIREFWLSSQFGLVLLFVIFTVVALLLNAITFSNTIEEIADRLSDYGPEDPFAGIEIRKIQRT